MAALLYAPVFSVVTRRFPHDFRRAIITLTFLGGLASTVFLPLTASLIHGLGWRQALMWLALTQWVVCAPLHFYCLRHAPPAVKAESMSGNALPKQRSHHVWSAPFLLIAVRTYALTAARNCGFKCSLPGMKPVTKAATTWVNNSVFHW